MCTKNILNKKVGNHRRFDYKEVDFVDFQAKSRISFIKGFSYHEDPRASNEFLFFYKAHNLCLEVTHMVCATTFYMNIFKGGEFSAFELVYIAISPYKTRSQNRLWLRPFELQFLSIGRSYQPTGIC